MFKLSRDRCEATFDVLMLGSDAVQTIGLTRTSRIL